MTVRRDVKWVPVLVGLFLFGVGGAAGQSVSGRVVAMGDTAGIPGVDVTLMDATGAVLAQVQAGETGGFHIPAPGPGRYLIRASRIGLSTVDAEVLVLENELIEIELRMAEEAIPLEPIVVVARREIRQGTLDEFYDRMARMRQRGTGQFLTREQIEKLTQLRLALLLQTIPGVWYWGRGESVSLLSTSGQRQPDVSNPPHHCKHECWPAPRRHG